MPDIEISKIILRRGPAHDLPGQPVNIQPREWTKGLDEGELAFASDEGRVFVGTDPERPLPTSNRLHHPYRNNEIIGENSVEGFAQLHGGAMRDGGKSDYYSAPMYPTDKPASSQNPDQHILEETTGMARYGVDRNDPLISGDGVPATRAVDASTASLVALGSQTGTYADPNRALVVNDFSRNRMVTLTEGSQDGGYIHTVEIRDTYGSMVASYAVADMAGHAARFTPVGYTPNGKMIGRVATDNPTRFGLGIYDEIGNSTSIPVITNGTYDADNDETILTATVSVPGDQTALLNLGPITHEGVNYYSFGNGMVSMGTVGDYIVVSCPTGRGQASDPASFLIFGTDGSFKEKIAMPAGYSDRIAYQWVRAGNRIVALVRPNASPTQTHFISFTPNATSVTMAVTDRHTNITQTLSQYGAPIIEYTTMAGGDNLLVFSSVARTVSGVPGSHHSVTKISTVDYSIAWSVVSVFVPNSGLPARTNDLFRSPRGNVGDRVSGNRFKWISPIGYHEINLTTGAIKTALWNETTITAPSALAFSTAPFAYDEAQDRIVFGGTDTLGISQYSFQNNSTEASGNSAVSYHAPNYFLGGDELTAKMAEMKTPNGLKSYIVNVGGDRWVGLYDSTTLEYINGWDGGAAVLGGTIIPASQGRCFLPYRDGRLLRIAVTNAGSINFTTIDMVTPMTDFGVQGMYVHDSLDNSIVVIGGPETEENDGRSFKWMIDTGVFKWARAYSGPQTNGETDDEDGLPRLPPCASQSVRGGYLGWVTEEGAVSLIDLSSGTRIYKGMAETTTGFDSSTPWGYSQWAWDSTNNALVYTNSHGGITGALTDDAIAEYWDGVQGINRNVDLIKIRFKRNAQGLWSTEVTRTETALDQSNKLPSDMRLWCDSENRFVYTVSNSYIKCYDLDTLQLVARAQSNVGLSFLKLWGSTLTQKLYFQYGSHDASGSWLPRLRSPKLFEPLMSVSLFGRHIPQGVTWKDVLIEGRPYEIRDIASVNAFIKYSVSDQNGARVRHGDQHLQYFYNPFILPGDIGSDTRPTMVDEANMVRAPEQDPAYNPVFDPSETVGQLGFRYVLVDENVNEPVLRFQYRNFTPDVLSLAWQVSRPTMPVPARGNRGFADHIPLGMTSYTRMDHELVVFIDYQKTNLDLWKPTPPYTRFPVGDPMSLWETSTQTSILGDYRRMFIHTTPGATEITAQAEITAKKASHTVMTVSGLISQITNYGGLAGFSPATHSTYQEFLDTAGVRTQVELVDCLTGLYFYYVTQTLYGGLANQMSDVKRMAAQMFGTVLNSTGIQSLSRIQVQTRTLMATSVPATGGTESFIRGARAAFVGFGEAPFKITNPLFGVPTGAENHWVNFSGGNYAVSTDTPGLVTYNLSDLAETTDADIEKNINIWPGYGATPISVGEGHILVNNNTTIHTWYWATEIVSMSPVLWPSSMQVSLYRPSDYGHIRSLTMDNTSTPLLDGDGVTVLGYLNVMRTITATANPPYTANPNAGQSKLLGENGTNSYLMAIRVPDALPHDRPEKPFPGWFWKIVVRVARSDATPGIDKKVKSETLGVGSTNASLQGQDLYWIQTGEWEWTAYGYRDFAHNSSAHITLQMGENFFDGIALRSSPDAPTYDNGNPRPRIYIYTKYWNGNTINVSNASWCVGKKWAYEYDYPLRKS